MIIAYEHQLQLSFIIIYMFTVQPTEALAQGTLTEGEGSVQLTSLR